MENIVKNIHKLNEVLSSEQKIDLEQSALSYRRHARIYFKILAVDTDKKELVVKVWQEKNPINKYLNVKELNERAKTLFGQHLPNYTIHSHPIPFTESPTEIVTADWVRKKMFEKRITNKQMVKDLGISKSDLSALVNGHAELSQRTKAMFYYYFKTVEKTISA